MIILSLYFLEINYKINFLFILSLKLIFKFEIFLITLKN